MASTSSLFEPIKVGNLRLKHRVVHAPLTRVRCDENHVPTPLVTEYYRQRTTEGGLIITEATGVSSGAGPFHGAPAIFTEEQIAGWKKVTEAVHANGGVFYMQLIHLGRASASLLLPEGKVPISASALPIQGINGISGKPYETPHALGVDEIMQVVQEFVQAAQNAIAAGFDGIEIHAANGYLIDQFINTSSNKRTDQYGGSIENRARFALEILDAVVAQIGQERVAIRFSPWSAFQDMEDETPYETWGYLVSEIQKRHPKMAYIHMIEPRDDYNGSGEDTVNTLDPFRKKWHGPFVSAGGYTTKPQLAMEVADRTGNLIAIGRAFLANPDIVSRLKNGYPLTKYDRSTFYTTEAGAIGYTDYPFYQETKA